MQIKRNPARFTLRKEYFGGLVYDAKTAKYLLLSQKEYDFLSNLTIKIKRRFAKIIKKDNQLQERILAFKKFGFVKEDQNDQMTLISTRVIKPPSLIPKGMLTAPIRVFDTYTRRCSFNCPQCYFSCDSLFKEERRTLEQTVAIMHKFYKAGTMEWRFTGGEPTIHQDLFDAIKIANSLGMNVGLYTNGWWNELITQKVLNSKLYEVVISLEGQREINDKRRKIGAYDRTINTFNILKDYNRSNPDNKINVTIATAVGKDNVNDVEFLIRLAASYNFNINFIPLKPSGRARNTLQNKMLSTKEFMGFSRNVQRIREDPEIIESGITIIHKYKDLFCSTYPDKSGEPFPFNYSECGALTTYISMLPDGRIFSCPFVYDLDIKGEFTGPNILEVSLEEAWYHPNLERFRHAEKVDCKGCVFYMKQCRGACRATVFGYGGKIKNGKLIGKDPYCYASLMPKHN